MEPGGFQIDSNSEESTVVVICPVLHRYIERGKEVNLDHL